MVPTPSPLVDEKRRLRRTMAAERGRLSPEARAEAAREVVARVLALPAFKAMKDRGQGACLAGFVAIRGELDPAGALAAARAAGVGVALPRVDTTWPPRLRFHRARGQADLADGPYGLTEPLPSCPEVDVSEIDLMLVPGLAFDAAGGRVGFGGGFYDDAGRRVREGARPGLMVAVGYDFQLVERCPTDERDVRVDVVVTDARTIVVGAAS
jgi:5-formyltetrahydrofolate cyclo-ligase